MKRWGIVGILMALGAAADEPRLQVVATTTILADVAREIAGPRARVVSLLPPGCDPHAFQPAPRDAARLAEADLIFANGLGLEESYLPGLLRRSRAANRVVEVSEGLEARRLDNGHPHHDGDGDHDHGEFDPHVWFDPAHVKVWARTIAEALASKDPGGVGARREAVERFDRRMDQLDQWAREQFDRVPPERRLMVTDHDSFGYLARRYGLEVVGAVAPGASAGAEPSARATVDLLRTMQARGVRAVFVGRGQGTATARRLARESGAELVELDTCALQDGQTYEDFFRQTVSRIVEALR